jgi:hypothetical protein
LFNIFQYSFGFFDLKVFNFFFIFFSFDYPRVSLTFMMLSVSQGYQLLWITPSVFSNVYYVVYVLGVSITLDQE